MSQKYCLLSLNGKLVRHASNCLNLIFQLFHFLSQNACLSYIYTHIHTNTCTRNMIKIKKVVKRKKPIVLCLFYYSLCNFSYSGTLIIQKNQLNSFNNVIENINILMLSRYFQTSKYDLTHDL